MTNPQYNALHETAGVLDLSDRGRICLTGDDRVRFLHGQVTNDIKKLSPGDGCYAALVTAKGRMESDLNIYCLQDELLLDFEPGLTEKVTARLEKYIVADDVQVVDVAPMFGLLSIQGPQAKEVIEKLGWFSAIPAKPFEHTKVERDGIGEVYLMNHARLGTIGFDLYIPSNALESVKTELAKAAANVSGTLSHQQAFEIVRIEAGIPRFGVDMDENNFPQECGIESSAVSYSKGCYIGQEVLNRIHTMGHVNRELRRLRFATDLKSLPKRRDKLMVEGKEVGYVTSAVASPRQGNIGLGYIRQQAVQELTPIVLQSSGIETMVFLEPRAE